MIKKVASASTIETIRELPKRGDNKTERNRERAQSTNNAGIYYIEISVPRAMACANIAYTPCNK